MGKPSTIPQPNDNHKKHLLIVGNCWLEIDLARHFIFYDLKKKVLNGGID